MKNRLLVATILLLPLGLFFYFWWHPGAVKTAGAGGGKTAPAAVVAGALARQSPAIVAIIETNFASVHPAEVMPDTAADLAVRPSGLPAPLQFTNFAPATVLENVRRAVRQYGEMFGGNPVGTNPEITRQLNGDNPKHINFLNADAGMRVNENGELTDSWGTPFFFTSFQAGTWKSTAPDPTASCGPRMTCW